MIAGDEGGERGFRRLMVEDGISGGDGDLADARAIRHVAEIDQAADTGGLAEARLDEDVEVVEIVMDGLARQPVERGLQRFESGDDLRHEFAARPFQHIEMRLDPAGLGQVPFRGIRRGCDLEVAQGEVEARGQRTELGEDGEWLRPGFAHRNTRKGALDPDHALLALSIRDLLPEVLAFGGEEARQRQGRIGGEGVTDRGALLVDEGRLALRAHRLDDDVAFAGPAAEVEVVFAAELPQPASDAELLGNPTQPDVFHHLSPRGAAAAPRSFLQASRIDRRRHP